MLYTHTIKSTNISPLFKQSSCSIPSIAASTYIEIILSFIRQLDGTCRPRSNLSIAASTYIEIILPFIRQPDAYFCLHIKYIIWKLLLMHV